MLRVKQPRRRVTVNFREKPFDGYAGINEMLTVLGFAESVLSCR